MIKHAKIIQLLIILFLFCSAFLAGCGFFQRHHAPRIEAPAQFMSLETRAFIDEPWWPMFQDSTLNRLIEEALLSSPSMDLAVARLHQFQALKRAAGSSLFPFISVSGSHQTGNQQFFDSFSDSLRRYDVRANTAYEVDLWRGLSAQRRAAAAQLIASENDAFSVVLTLTAQVARTYYTVVQLREQLKLLESTEESYSIYNEAVNNRYEMGIVTSLDVYQAQSNFAGARALTEQTAGALAVAEHALSVLLGRYPQINVSGTLDSLPRTVQAIGAGLPSELLMRRPDIRAADALLVAADYEWAATHANRFPRLSLTGSFGNVSRELEDAIDPSKMTLNLAAGLVLPIFEGGRLRAEEQRAAAAFREAVANYEMTVLNAFREVEDALVLGERQAETIRQLETATQAADQTLEIAIEQYTQGLTDYLTVLVAQTTQLNAAQSLIAARFDLISYRIDLATALGGSWSQTAIERLETYSNSESK